MNLFQFDDAKIRALLDVANSDPAGLTEALIEYGKSEHVKYGEFVVGDTVFIRAIPFHYIGRIASIDGEKLGLWPVQFVRNTGQWTEALQTGKVESRPFPQGTGPVYVTRATIHNPFRWPHTV
jgi:hypothetical protein